jgi:hypothetical protein
MRKIEQNMNRALVTKNNWSQSNTQVVYNQEENRSSVYLHGHEIACYDHNTNSVQLDSCGYETNTTKSRLNAILDEVKYGAKVFQRNWTWFVSYNNQTTTFDNGMILT